MASSASIGRFASFVYRVTSASVACPVTAMISCGEQPASAIRLAIAFLRPWEAQFGRPASSHHLRILFPRPFEDRLFPLLVSKNVNALFGQISSTERSSEWIGMLIRTPPLFAVFCRRYCSRFPLIFPHPSATASVRAAPVYSIKVIAVWATVPGL